MARPKKVLEKLNDGWQTQVREGGQIELAQDTPEPDPEDEGMFEGDNEDLGDSELDEDWLEDDEEENEDDGRPAPSSSTAYRPSGGQTAYGHYKRNCIVCGEEFDSTRSHARFCHKATCRQAFNRRENSMKDCAAKIDRAIVALKQAMQLTDDSTEADKLLAVTARGLLLAAEKSVLKQLDEILPDRHPKPEITAVPTRVDPASLKPGEAAFVFFDADPTIETPIKVYKSQFDSNARGFVGCHNSATHQYQREMYFVPRSAIWLRIVEPGEGGGNGRHG
jgi:hypothetical protein